MRIRSSHPILGLLVFLLGLSINAQDLPEGFEPIDRSFQTFMRAQGVPGASLAIVKNGRLVLARGYGMADVEQAQPVTPTSLFRIGSISKTVTAIAVMNLVQAGKLDLDARAFDILADIRPRSSRIADSRINRITVRNLLQHSGGWDSSRSGDPMSSPRISEIAASMNVSFPPSCPTIIAYMLDRNLDFDPGTRYSYSNFGFCVLGRIIEKVTNRRYDEFVFTEVLAPLGVERMRLGRTVLTDRAPGEVRYYDYAGASLIDSLMPSIRGKVAVPYSGVLPLESVDSVGAWIASAADIARIFTMLDGSRQPAVLSASSIQEMALRPVFGPAGPEYYGLGIAVVATGNGQAWWHNGGLPGTRAFAIRTPAGYTWAALFNSRPRDDSSFDGYLSAIFVPEALDSVKWPDVDLFPRVHPSGKPTVAAAGVVNAASGVPGPVAPGQLITIFGTFLAPADAPAPTISAEGIYPTRSSDVQVLLNGVAAPLLYLSPSQINAIVPFQVAGLDQVGLQVTTANYGSNPMLLACTDTSPALFTADGSGMGLAAAVNQDGRANSPTNPAAAGSVVTVFGTGFGITTPEDVNGAVSRSGLMLIAAPISATVNGKNARVLFAGAAPELVAGVAQINVAVPADALPGMAELIVTAGKFRTPPVSVAIK